MQQMTAPTCSRNADCGRDTITCEGTHNPFASPRPMVARSAADRRARWSTARRQSSAGREQVFSLDDQRQSRLPASPRSATVTRSPRHISRETPTPHWRPRSRLRLGASLRADAQGRLGPALPRQLLDEPRCARSGNQIWIGRILERASGRGRGGCEWRSCCSSACHVTLAGVVRKLVIRSRIAAKPREETMRRFNVHLVIDVDFEDGDEASDKTVQNFEKHLRGIIQSAARELSLRTVKGTRVETVVVEENTGSPPTPTAM